MILASTHAVIAGQNSFFKLVMVPVGNALESKEGICGFGRSIFTTKVSMGSL